MRLAHAIVACLVVTACGRDFDALFGDAPPADAGTLPPPPVVDPGEQQEAEAGAAACTPIHGGACTAAEMSEACDTVKGVCSTSCNGCCRCGVQTCRQGDNNRQCQARCENGATCSVTCSLNGPCNLACVGCTSARLTCGSTNDGCFATCSAGASCTEECSAAKPCEMVCPAGAACALQCAPTSTTCRIECPTAPKDCGGRLFVCGRECP